MARLEAEHATRPLDLILITGDMTDAGRSAEWAEFFDILAGHPDLADRMLILPGNHDVNVVDRANPARLDLPFSPAKTLRKMRALSAMAAFGADRLRVMSAGAASPASRLRRRSRRSARRSRLSPIRAGFRLSNQLARLWDELFPLILPPAEDDGLGVAILNSNADTNFSFTNALGMIPVGQARKLTAAFDRYPKARWIVGLHHHLIEYPMPVAKFSERIGTALVNGSWFQRVLKPYAERDRRHARPPPCRLDRRLRRAQGRLRPVAGDGAGIQSHPFLCPCAWAGAGRAPGADGADADRPRRLRRGQLAV